MAPETGKPRQDVLDKMAWQVTLEMKERTGRRRRERRGTRVLGQDFRGRSAGQDFRVGQLDRTTGTGEPEHDSRERTATARRGKKVQNSHMTTRTGQLQDNREEKTVAGRP
jgi:hypothetical protein